MPLSVESIESGGYDLARVFEEVGKAASNRLGQRRAWVLMRKWRSMVANGTGFAVLDGGTCVGMVLYSSEYELRFSSFLSETSARKLPRNVTIWLSYLSSRARDAAGANDSLSLKTVISRLRTDASVETIAVQAPALYEADLERTLSRIGFMNCRRVRMYRPLSGRIARAAGPPGCRLETPSNEAAEDLMSVIYSGYFSEIDGYLFPDISAVCSDIALFREFLSNSEITLSASVVARVQGYPSGCIVALRGDVPHNGLVGVVAVSPGMRRRGIGRAMLLYVLRKFQEMHYAQASLAVTVENLPALSLYQSLGFEEAGQRTNVSVWRRSVSRPLMNFRR